MYRITYLLAFVILTTCTRKEHVYTPAFYHWQTNLQLTQSQQQYLDLLRINRLYVRFFDVDWDPEFQDAIPLAEVHIDTQGLTGMEIIPTIFITNQTMQRIQANQIPLLADRIISKIETLRTPITDPAIPEIQIDCDWTQTTRIPFFQLLELLRQKAHAKNWQLSATIRLHQYSAFRQTGVPPVDRGMLMCYNTGDLEDWQESNSIYQEQHAKPYLTHRVPYPLPLDLAVPAFQWGVLFRNGQLVRLIHGLDSSALSNDPRFRQIGSRRFLVQKSTYLDGYYLYRGDRIRLEQTGIPEMESALNLFKSILASGSAYTLSVYHLDTALVQKIPHASMARLFQKAR